MSVYELITNRILEQLDKGIVPWRKPWTVQMPKNLITGKAYKGINILMLSFTDYKSPYWLTYKQAKNLKGNVKTREKGTPVVYWNFVKVKAESSKKEKVFPLLKYHTVFNAEQCENITVPIETIEFSPIEECERVITSMQSKPAVQYGGDKACYIPKRDTVKMPHKEVFRSTEEFYSTLFHEFVHATGHGSRLDREGINEPHAFGSETYSKEELIAELGASFICGITGITSQTIDNQASYIGNWLSRLKKDKKLIITAASQAQKAVDYILNRADIGG